MTGRCLCSAIQFAVETPSAFCAHCHCTLCQRGHGAAYVTWFAVPRERFWLEKGEASLVRYNSSDHGTRSFCGRCGSSLFCETSHSPDQIDIVLANMDAPIDREPNLHMYWSDRAAWASTDSKLARLGGETGLEPVED